MPGMVKFHSEQPVVVNLNNVKNALSEIRNHSMSGWMELPERINSEELNSIKTIAHRIQEDSKFLVCIGIGGSYLGHRAIIEALGQNSHTEVLYAGNSLSARSLDEVLKKIGDADFSVNVISKSGTTLEPAVAFRFLKEKLLKKYGREGAAERIYATTDGTRGALHDEAVQEGYTKLVVPDDVGGRYSVLSPVGLLPLAVANVDIEALIAGARDEKTAYADESTIAAIPAVQYAVERAAMLRDNYAIEILATFEPCLHYLEEWWKQLFGESEGKNGQGIFPASVMYTTDLHSLGQYIQDGRRDIFETFLRVESPGAIDYIVPTVDGADADGLQYLVGKRMSELNQIACAATIDAHRQGGIPVFELVIPDLTEHSLGGLIYFFEYTCALSARLSGVDPFDQPGVEQYKQKMYQLLGKSGN